MSKERLPVYWGNQLWVRDEKGRIRQTNRRVKRSSNNWIDYKTMPGGSTAAIRTKADQEGALRNEFNDQIIEKLINSKLDCVDLETPTLIITCGGTASGKTSAVDMFLKRNSDSSKYIRIDFDGLKHRLPEYQVMIDLKMRQASEFVQVEASRLGGKLFKRSIKKKMNVIYEKTNGKESSVTQTKEEIKKARKKGYAIFLVSTHLTVEEGLERAETRFRQNGRHVPEEHIRKTYSYVPEATLELSQLVDASLLMDNRSEVLQGMAFVDDSGPEILDEELYKAYLDKVGVKFDICRAVS